jgi:hypothetical protein
VPNLVLAHKMKFLLRYTDCDLEEEIEEESRFHVIQRLLEDWKRCDIDLHGVFRFLEANGIIYGIDDDDVDEGTENYLLENAANDVLRLITNNDTQELAFLISVSDSVQIDEVEA